MSPAVTTQHTEKCQKEILLVKVTPAALQFAQDQAVSAGKPTKEFLKTLLSTTTGAVLDSPPLTKISNGICGKIFCAGPEAKVNSFLVSYYLTCVLHACMCTQKYTHIHAMYVYTYIHTTFQ
jgi:hypothetical protein